jgi:hypothetical protein
VALIGTTVLGSLSVGEVIYNLSPFHSSLRIRPKKMKLIEDKPRISEPSQID